ncbi:MAG: 5-oxoprolinase subunit PxpB [Gemmatimonadales bacterium]
MTGGMRASVGPLGDQAVLLTLDGDRERCNRRIARLTAALLAESGTERSRAIIDVVPAMVSLAVFFDPRLVAPDVVERRLLACAERVEDAAAEDAPLRVHVVPVRYDGPDLAEVAERLGLLPDELVQRHVGREYRVRFLGFTPGFAYLGPLDPSLVLPRRADPRRRVPAGSVGVAGDQTAIYPLETPGGWHLIGRTELRPFDPSRFPPSLFVAGDRVRFARATS